ncbi:GIY-YIG nuclease family protein [Streptosporangium sp. G12]
MNNGISLPIFKGNHHAHDQLDRLCCANACQAPIDEDTPVPLCVEHLRIAFAHVLVNAEHMAAEVPEPIEQEAQPGQTHGAASLTTQGFVYFVRFSDRVKIGWSANPPVRLRNIPHDEVLAIVPGTMLDERRCHTAFAHLRTIGEWFTIKPDLVAFIASLPRAA